MRRTRGVITVLAAGLLAFAFTALITGYAYAHVGPFQDISDALNPAPGPGNGTLHVLCMRGGAYVGAHVKFFIWNGTNWEYRFEKNVASGYYTVQEGTWKLVADSEGLGYYLEPQEKVVEVRAGETTHACFFWASDGSAASWSTINHAIDSAINYIMLSVQQPLCLAINIIVALIAAKVRRR